MMRKERLAAARATGTQSKETQQTTSCTQHGKVEAPQMLKADTCQSSAEMILHSIVLVAMLRCAMSATLRACLASKMRVQQLDRSDPIENSAPFIEHKQAARQHVAIAGTHLHHASLFHARRNFRHLCTCRRCGNQKKSLRARPHRRSKRLATNASCGSHASLRVRVLLDTSRAVRIYARQALVTPQAGIWGRAASSRRDRLWYTAPATLSLAPAQHDCLAISSLFWQLIKDTQ
jgi:hypothetical protein